MSGRRVVVQAPDERGLRAVTVDGAPAGSAWSLRDLRRQLRRAGLPPDTDLADRASVTWRGADGTLWPDRTLRRRATIALLVAGLLVSALLLADIGMVDALGALTFSGRLTGMLLVLAGAVQAVAAAAVFDFWGKRTLRYSGALVLLGVLIAVGTEALLMAVWFQEREWTPYLPVFLALSLWSVWAAWTVWRARAWKGIPYPRSFTAGVAATAVLASANFAYSAVYQPHAALFHFKVQATFGTPKRDPERPVIYLPVKLHVANDGAVPAYVLNSAYLVYGRESVFDGKKTVVEQKKWRADTEGRADVELHVQPTGYQVINSGPVVPVDSWVAPGADYSTERVVQIPTDAPYDLVMATVSVTFMRGDRGKVDDELRYPVFSWKQKTDRFFDCAAVKCLDYVLYHARVRHNNNIINVTRRPRYINTYRSFGAPNSGIAVLISPRDSKGHVSADAESSERYGVDQYDSAVTEIPFATLLDPGRSPAP
ncbi:hypothetical protein ACFZBM_16875 [Streptomyces lavendulae]|uniref:Uncharacterized protein n=1 Tax=Streptomyces lavendulae subsp. lavendulae TaxID=58340 RepID=A0A2K8PLM7_STRLA|nr:hypothetical protein [Streptomyces lavendulae]ATZ27000.1 hypothetical protein SLAV_26040 [Streptomyces lavendulae subsp. lavendulae]QUQ56827.1 hypothetical protein SLLC_24175 [Streptomyces lavendulae subsp. lavendulae]